MSINSVSQIKVKLQTETANLSEPATNSGFSDSLESISNFSGAESKIGERRNQAAGMKNLLMAFESLDINKGNAKVSYKSLVDQIVKFGESNGVKPNAAERNSFTQGIGPLGRKMVEYTFEQIKLLKSGAISPRNYTINIMNKAAQLVGQEAKAKNLNANQRAALFEELLPFTGEKVGGKGQLFRELAAADGPEAFRYLESIAKKVAATGFQNGNSQGLNTFFSDTNDPKNSSFQHHFVFFLQLAIHNGRGAADQASTVVDRPAEGNFGDINNARLAASLGEKINKGLNLQTGAIKILDYILDAKNQAKLGLNGKPRILSPSEIDRLIEKAAIQSGADYTTRP